MGYPRFFLDNRLADAAPIADSTASGYDVANLTDLRPYTWFKPNTLPCRIKVNCGSLKAANYALIFGHDLASQGVTVEVHGSTDDFVTSDDLLASSAPVDDNALLLPFVSAQYTDWALDLSAAGSPTPLPSIAIAMIGTALEMPSSLASSFDPIGRTVIEQANNNEDGQPLGSLIEFEQFQQTLNFGPVDYAWIRDVWMPAWRGNIRGTPFLFGWDTDNYPEEIVLLKTAGFKTPHYDGSYVSPSLDVMGVATP